MFATFICMAHQQDVRVIALAALICAFGAATSLRLLQGATQVRTGLRTSWLLAAGACGGASIWVFHFISMLAFDPGVPTAFDPAYTLASLAIALGGGAGAVYLMTKTPKPWRNLVWGIAFTAGTACMHYVGMASLRLPGHLSWHPGLILASAGFGVSVSALARIVGLHHRSRLGMLVATTLVLIAVCGLHFIGMAAMTIILDPSVPAPPVGLPHEVLALAVSALSLGIGLVCFWTVWLETRSRRSSLERVHAIIDALPQAVAYFDDSDRYVLGNTAFETEIKQLGVTPNRDLAYRSILSRVQLKGDTDPDTAANDWIDAHLADRRLGTSVLDHELVDGRVLRVETRHTSLGGNITVLSDITDLKRQAADLAAARDAAEAADEAKSQFLANMSHELRTPMNGVIAVADLLAHEPITSKQHELVNLIQSSGRILDRVLRDLLDIAQIEAGVLEIVEAPFEVAVAVNEIVQIFTPEAAAKDIAIEFHPSALVNEFVLGDVDRLKQILVNLIANAVKFTEKGRVDIAVANLGKATVFTIADTGIGFDITQKERLFSRFEQSDGSTTRRFGGAGLGLAIASDLAIRMGGTLTCDSTPGCGSVFFLTLPLKAATAPAPIIAPDAPAERPEDESPQILIVDDVAANRQVLSLILDSVGIRTSTADNGQEAVACWREGSFDVVLMDIQMPVMDGLSAVRMIREDERSDGRDRTSIIMVSANAMPEHVRASLDAGADAHLAKPITAERLFAALANIGEPEPDAEAQCAA